MSATSARVRLAALVVTLGVVVAVAVVTAQTNPAAPPQAAAPALQAHRESPPGVAPGDWVPLGERSGLAIVGRTGRGPVIARLWVKVGAEWEPALLQAPPDSIIPAR